jgi:hypothetical protein
VADNYGEQKEKDQINVLNRKIEIKIYKEMYVSSVSAVPNSKISKESWYSNQVVQNSKHVERQTTNREEDIECDTKCTFRIHIENTKRIK